MALNSFSVFVIGLGCLATASAALSFTNVWDLSNTPFVSLNKDSSFESSEDFKSENIFGRKYKYLLVSHTKENLKWWSKSFRKLDRNRNKLSPNFKSVKQPFNIKGSEALNRVCKLAYLTNTNNVNNTVLKNIYRESDVWKYCSFLGSKPKTIEESKDSYSSGKIGDSKKSTLISVKNSSNNLFWSVRQDEFFESFNDVADKASHTFFGSFFRLGKNPNNTIKDKCEYAYRLSNGTNGTGSTSPTSTEIEKYCSLTALVPKKN